MHINFFEILMFVFTLLILAGVYRSIKARNKFAIGFGLIALVVFLFSDGLILYYAMQPK